MSSFKRWLSHPKHDWFLAQDNLTRVPGDMRRKGELWKCHHCPAVKIK